MCCQPITKKIIKSWHFKQIIRLLQFSYRCFVLLVDTNFKVSCQFYNWKGLSSYKPPQIGRKNGVTGLQIEWLVPRLKPQLKQIYATNRIDAQLVKRATNIRIIHKSIYTGWNLRGQPFLNWHFKMQLYFSLSFCLLMQHLYSIIKTYILETLPTW